jgi:hypothetical protein
LRIEPSPQVITAEIEPNDHVDHDKWYREEHLDLASKVTGYRRTKRYMLGPDTPMTKENSPTTLTVHEFDDVMKALGDEKFKQVATTEWAKKRIADNKINVRRVWKLVTSYP